MVSARRITILLIGALGPALAGCSDGGRGSCTFEVDASLSSAISTVGIVTWSLDRSPIDEAHIDFGLDGAEPTFTAPVDLDDPEHRTLLLGMKAEHTYSFQIVADSEGDTCTSDAQTLTTGSLPSSLPAITTSIALPDEVQPGFIVTSQGIQGGGGGGGGGGDSSSMILDSDGDIVWWADAPFGTSRARMSWEGDAMWEMATNVDGNQGEVRRVSMDGLDNEEVSELADGHHDFTVLPGGIVSAIVHNGGCDAIVERSSDGTVTTVVDDVSSLYEPVQQCHANSILYHPGDDSYTIGDRNPNAFVKLTRAGALQWQFGGTNPLGEHFPGSWEVNHGHEILANGDFLLFTNGAGGFGGGGQTPSRVLEYALDASTWTATLVWEYDLDAEDGSATLGDVQRLPGGNTLIAASNAGALLEVNPDGAVVREITSDSFGFADFRTSLYGEPLR